MAIININNNICFSEGDDIDRFIRNVSREFGTIKENIDIANKINTFHDNLGSCIIQPGIRPFYGENDILNSNFYNTNTIRSDLYENSYILLSIKSNSLIADNSELIITDYINNEIRFVFKTSSDIFDGSTDEFGSVIIGINNLQSSEYLQRINLAIRNFLKVNPGLNFKITIDNYNNQTLLLKQRNSGVLGSVYVVAPDAIQIIENMSGKFSKENYDYELEYKPYREDIVIKKSIKNNPRIFKKTLGIDNLDYEEPIYFDDSLTKFNNDFYFESPDRIKWNFTYNSKAINSLSTTISPIDTVNIIEGKITTEQSLLGIKGDIVCFGKDARQRSNLHTNMTKLIPNELYSFVKNADVDFEYNLEPFNDESFDDLVAIRSTPFQVNYKFTKSTNNGVTFNKLVEIDTPRNLTILSNNILVYNEDKMNILPFYEREMTRKNYLNQSEDQFLDNNVLSFKHYTCGRDINSEYSILPESIAYYGEIE